MAATPSIGILIAALFIEFTDVGQYDDADVLVREQQ